MTPEIILLLVIVAVALVLFSVERFPADVIAIGVLLVLLIAGLLPAELAFRGFGSDVVVMIFGLLILTAALARTGVVELVGRWIIRRTGDDPMRIQLITMSAVTGMSTLISNTAAAAFFIPVVYGLASRAKVSVSRLLMPVAFGAILASSVSLISTSTNIVVSGLMVQSGMSPMSMFELAPVGIPIALSGLVYMYFFGAKLIPDRRPPAEPVKELSNQVFLTEVVIMPDSPLVGRTLAESGLGKDLDLNVVRIIREKEQSMTPSAEMTLFANDLLLVEGPREEVLKVRNVVGIDLKGDVELSDPRLQNKDFGMAEVLVMGRAPLIGRTLRGVQFRERYGLQVLAINRHGETISHKISQVVIQLGDILLVQGQRPNITALQSDATIRVIGPVEDSIFQLRRAPIAIVAFLGALLLATFEVVPLPVAVILGVLLVFVTRTITPSEAYRDVEWKAIVLIGCMLGLGVALERTGAAAYLANLIVDSFGHTNPRWILSGFFFLTMLLTQPMSNQAAAVVVVPIAMQAANQLGLNPRTFAMMIAVAASCSYLTPLEPACLMVYGPGNYRFSDFLKVGSLLTIVIYLIAILMVPVIWPL